MKGLLFLFGESFRDGGHQTRKRDTQKSFFPQKTASESHNRFCDYMKTYNIQMDIFINTYDTKYEKELKSWYSHPLTYKSNTKVTTDKMKFKSIQVALNVIKKDKYDFILIARLDTLMKPQFFKTFNPKWDKLLFFSQESKSWNCGMFKDKVTYPLVNPMFKFIPKSYFYVLDNIDMDHWGWTHYINTFGLKSTDMGFMVNEHHSSNSSKSSNSYYKVVGRPENKRCIDGEKINRSLYGKTKKIKCKKCLNPREDTYLGFF